MGVPVLVMGESGSGKSTSLRNFNPEEIGIFSVAGKPMPFRKRLKISYTSDYNIIIGSLMKPKLKTYAIDDSQYLMAFEFFNRANEPGFQKFTDIGVHFQRLVHHVIYNTPPDVIVYCVLLLTISTFLIPVMGHFGCDSQMA